MRKITKSIFAVLLALIILLASSAILVSAAEGELIVNKKISYKVGDTVTYDLRLQSSETVVGIQMDIVYDSQYLKIVDEDSVETPKFGGSIINTNLDNNIKMVWTSPTKPGRFMDEATLIKVDFEVIKEGKTDITYFIEEMYSMDLTYLKEYTLTVDFSQNGTVVVEDEPPVVETNPDFVDENQGDFPNYADGKGENNTDTDDNRTIVTSPNKVNEPNANDNNGGNNNNANNNAGNNNAANANNNANQNAAAQVQRDENGNVLPTNSQGKVLSTNAEGNYVDENGNILTTDGDGNYVDSNGNVYQENIPVADESEPVDIVPIIIVVAIVLAAIAIIAIVVLKSRTGNDKRDEDDSMNTSKEAETENPDVSDDNE